LLFVPVVYAGVHRRFAQRHAAAAAHNTILGAQA
jgi:hypothetical protein